MIFSFGQGKWGVKGSPLWGVNLQRSQHWGVNNEVWGVGGWGKSGWGGKKPDLPSSSRVITSAGKAWGSQVGGGGRTLAGTAEPPSLITFNRYLHRISPLSYCQHEGLKKKE